MYSNVRKTKKAFTIAEMIVALTLMAMLMTAVAIAFNASAINCRDNEEIYKSINAARQTLIRLTNQLRTANPTEFVDGESATECTIEVADGSIINYYYSADEEILYLTNDADPDSDYVMCRNVTGVSFDRTASTEEPDQIANVQVTITVESGSTSETLSSAIALRRCTDI